ncbi:MAG: phenylalanine--tRNA ligase subunit alpha [Candidatus Pacebacteria bacterium]|nr:phenylalanine--tRNA ligase subunit alpha [Candidatus Paceibacterota bacterium]
MNLEEIKNRAKEEIEKIVDLKQADDFFKKYLGKKGEIAKVFDSLKDLAIEEKKSIGQQANTLKKEIEEFFNTKNEEIKNAKNQTNPNHTAEKIDITRPGQKIQRGHLHPLTLVMNEACSIFQTMGFEIAQGPELETEWYNFDALNVPKDHPARDMQDTFWLRQNVSEIKNQKSKIKDNEDGFYKSNRLLMRTQTSPVQIRYMESHQPPLRIIAPGRVFRNEATDAKHGAQFYQLEGLMVDKEVAASNFKAIIEDFLKRFFKTNVEMRLRPGFFPFTEPSFEIDVKRPDGKWMEIMGAGMVHPNVFRSAGLNASVKPGLGWQGFAFGVGIDRLAIVKYKITDIRLLYQNDLRFLNQF